MKTFTSLSDLDKLTDDDPTRPVVKQLLAWLIADVDFPDHPYNPDDHGYIALVEPGDVQRELDDIDMPHPNAGSGGSAAVPELQRRLLGVLDAEQRRILHGTD